MSLEPRVDRLALQGQHAEDALVDAAQGLVADEPLQPFDSERELAMGQPALAGQPALPEPFEVLGQACTRGRR